MRNGCDASLKPTKKGLTYWPVVMVIRTCDGFKIDDSHIGTREGPAKTLNEKIGSHLLASCWGPSLLWLLGLG